MYPGKLTQAQALRVFIGLSSWFFDFLHMCRDPGLSPLDPEGWEGALETQLKGYLVLFVMGRSRAAQTVRDAVEELQAVVSGPEEATIMTVLRPEDINGTPSPSHASAERRDSDLVVLQCRSFRLSTISAMFIIPTR